MPNFLFEEYKSILVDKPKLTFEETSLWFKFLKEACNLNEISNGTLSEIIELQLKHYDAFYSEYYFPADFDFILGEGIKVVGFENGKFIIANAAFSHGYVDADEPNHIYHWDNIMLLKPFNFSANILINMIANLRSDKILDIEYHDNPKY
jgi:hypothetical protein